MRSDAIKKIFAVLLAAGMLVMLFTVCSAAGETGNDMYDSDSPEVDVLAEEQASSETDALAEGQASPETDALAEGQESSEADVITEGQASPETDALAEGQESSEADVITEGQVLEVDTITKDQAFEAVKNYCYMNNPDLKGIEESGEYTVYWDISTNEDQKIVILFRSYTGSQTRYYIDPESGDTYVTELVPGIIDEEQKTDESFNVRDYLPESTAQEGTENSIDFDRAKLIEMAIENQKNSYAPYSGFNVSAAVLMDSGEIYLGVNVENASYSAAICAERNAIAHAVECGERKIVAIAIVGGADYQITDYCAPCGICRQFMREFCDPEQMKVIFAISPTDYKEMTLEELMPESFGPSMLGK